MRIEETIDFAQLQLAAAFLTNRDANHISPPIQLYPNSERELAAITANRDQSIKRYDRSELLAVYENPTNGMLTLFMNSFLDAKSILASASAIEILDPKQTEIKFFWREFPGITYHPETLVRTLLTLQDFPRIESICVGIANQKGTFLLVADHQQGNSPRIDIVCSVS